MSSTPIMMRLKEIFSQIKPIHDFKEYPRFRSKNLHYSALHTMEGNTSDL